MIKDTISKISNDFIIEANNSPKMLEDMASMEKYMCESYNGRIFVELLQNADDCNSDKVLLTKLNGDIIFANNGKKFDEDDIISISRSGASSKQRGVNIGYRGVGFKSTTYLSNEIIIYSDETYFTFSKSTCSKILEKPENNIPTIRIPFLVDNVDSKTKDVIDDLVQKGYSTIFIFKNAHYSVFLEELRDINNGYFIFLKNILQCKVDIEDCKKIYKLKRENHDKYKLLSILGNKNESWIIVENEKVSIAFKYEEGKIVACKSEDAVYHCYLPTYDKVVYPIKVNSDFSTDPSRKHITPDKITNESINSVADLMFDILNYVFSNSFNPMFSNVLSIIYRNNSFSNLNIKLKEVFKDKLVNTKWLTTNKGTRISANEYKILPNWLEDSEKLIVRKYSNYIYNYSLESNVYRNILHVDEFLSAYSTCCFSTSDLIEILKEKEFVSNLNSKTYSKFLGNVIKSVKIKEQVNGEKYDFSDIAILTDQGIKSIVNISDEKIKQEIIDEISQIVSKSDLDWFFDKTQLPKCHVFNRKFKTQNKIMQSKTTSSKPVISKWRSAENHCVELEKYFGNKAIDISKQNIGYDIESTTPNGSKRYIEVKLLSKSNSFTITNNEYTAAHQYGEEYYLCLITQDEKQAKVIYVQNPLNCLSFEKRVRQWEWFCDNYYGEEYLLDVK